MAGEIWIEEFLYRGRPPGDPRDPAWHLSVGKKGTDAFDKPVLHVTPPMNIAQAEERGWGLPKILEAVNADALRECERLRQSLADAHRAIVEWENENALLRRQLEAALSAAISKERDA